MPKIKPLLNRDGLNHMLNALLNWHLSPIKRAWQWLYHIVHVLLAGVKRCLQLSSLSDNRGLGSELHMMRELRVTETWSEVKP